MSVARWLAGVAAIAVACNSQVELGRIRENGSVPGSGGSGLIGTGGERQNGQAGATGGAEDTWPCCGASVTDRETDGSGEACAAEEYAMESSPVDVLIMMDRSESMNQRLEDDTMTRWEGIRAAVREFVMDSEVQKRQIRIGIQFFPITTGNIPERDCNVDNYASPAVDIGDVAEVGEEILAEIDSQTRAGLTPTLPALQGALKHATQWASDHVDDRRPTVVLLVTDGMPTSCQDPVSVSAVAKEAAGALREEPAIRTFVVGIGPGLSNLDQIAERGGTGRAFIFKSGSAESQLINALRNITLTELTCQFEIPAPPSDGQVINYEKIRVFFSTDPAGTCAADQEVPWVNGRSGCEGSGNGGWYFDDESDPRTLQVCPCTCALFGVGRVEIQSGCSPLGR